jgi:hypothetical protein
LFKHGYNRPENLWKDFNLERKTEAVNSRGKAVDSYDTENPIFIHAILCGATPEEQMAFKQAGHPVSHTISHQGHPIGKPGDRLVMGPRTFYIQSVDDPGDLGIWTLYYCEERGGTQDGSPVVGG